MPIYEYRCPNGHTFEVFQRMTRVVWGIIDTAFSNVVITPGATRTDDVAQNVSPNAWSE